MSLLKVGCRLSFRPELSLVIIGVLRGTLAPFFFLSEISAPIICACVHYYYCMRAYIKNVRHIARMY